MPSCKPSPPSAGKRCSKRRKCYSKHRSGSSLCSSWGSFYPACACDWFPFPLGLFDLCLPFSSCQSQHQPHSLIGFGSILWSLCSTRCLFWCWLSLGSCSTSALSSFRNRGEVGTGALSKFALNFPWGTRSFSFKRRCKWRRWWSQKL